MSFYQLLACVLYQGGCALDDSVRDAQSLCGDGTVSAVEECDDGNAVDDDGCTQSCNLARCGDGIVRAGLGEGEEGYEACDDGNDIDDDGCNSECRPAVTPLATVFGSCSVSYDGQSVNRIQRSSLESVAVIA